MASNECDLDKILELLDLSDYYPEKLTRTDLYQITKESISDDDEYTNCSVSWRFIYRITRFNYQARNFKNTNTDSSDKKTLGYRAKLKQKKKEEKDGLHPLDVLIGVFLCCDPIARQDLVRHLWGCKLAIPYALQLHKREKVTVYLWPLRSIVCQYENKQGFSNDVTIIKEKMKCIAFIRIGKNENLSKSFLINSLIGGSEKAHPMFFHRDSEGSKSTRSNVADGAIELGWFLPKGSVNDRFDGCRLFANLRGDSKYHTDQRSLIAKMATFTIVLSTLEILIHSNDIINCLLESQTCIIILITDKNPDENKLLSFLELYEKEPDTKIDIVLLKDKRLPDILYDLHFNLNKMENEKRITLSDFTNRLPTVKTQVDERREPFPTGMDMAYNVITALTEVEETERRIRLLPFQGEHWRQWSLADRDYHRFDQLEPEEKKKYHNREQIDKDKRHHRSEQFKLLSKRGLSKLMSLFLDSMSILQSNSRKIFLRLLQLELDEISRKGLKPFYIKYQELVNSTIDADEKKRKQLNLEFLKLDKYKQQMTFGLEHITREIGQIFEACDSQNDTTYYIKINEGHKKIPHTDLPKYASFILLEGYPIEILDGEACSVPRLWIKHVIGVLNKEMLPECRVHAIAVLGIQSSGKSTFLNTIFGLQFAVSAGRCTRGAYIQLIKVHESLKDELQTDYIVAIDTEGLKAIEVSSDISTKRDNELSTFVIGLADTTVINLMGENATYLQENLPIAVHAFLRMNLVGLHPRCTIVHHNVDKRNKDILLQQGRVLESMLNKLTGKACELEKIPHKQFKEIIEFSINEHTDYVPALLDGEQPMAAINIGYSMESNRVRTKLTRFINQTSSKSYEECRSSTIYNFGHHLEALWNAIQTDRFVYEFRTTIETEAKLKLESKYSEIMASLLGSISKLVKRYIPKLTSDNFQEKQNKLDIDFKALVKKSKCELGKYLNTPDKTDSACFQKWKDDYTKRLDFKMNDYWKSTCRQFLCAYKIQQKKQHVPIPVVLYEKFFSKYRKYMQNSDKTPKESFDIAWDEWILLVKSTKRDENNVRDDTTTELRELCYAHEHLIDKSVVGGIDLDEFIPTTEKYMNITSYSARSSNPYVLQYLQNMKSTVKYELEKELQSIKLLKLPYSSLYPAQILLRVKKHLNKRLAEDTDRQILHQFEIDLLIAAGGTIIKELKENARGADLQLIQLLQEKVKPMIKELTIMKDKHNENVLKVIITIIESILLEKFYPEQTNVLFNGLDNCFKSQIQSKQSLMRSCIRHFITQNKDNMMMSYIQYPKAALCQFIEILLKKLYNSRFEKYVLPQISIFVMEYLSDLESRLNKCKYVGASTKDLMIELFGNSECVHSNFAKPLISNIRDKEIDITLLIATLHRKLGGFQIELENVLKKNMQSNMAEVVPVCADEMYTRLSGCSELCPFCQEICIFSENHTGPHQSLIHRPVGLIRTYWADTDQLSFENCQHHIYNNNLFNHRGKYIPFKDYKTVHPNWEIRATDRIESSCIWKWIFVNKFELLKQQRMFSLPDNLPSSWASIKKHEAIRELEKDFLLI